jgi:hypothetical protein
MCITLLCLRLSNAQAGHYSARRFAWLHADTVFIIVSATGVHAPIRFNESHDCRHRKHSSHAQHHNRDVDTRLNHCFTLEMLHTTTLRRQNLHTKHPVFMRLFSHSCLKKRMNTAYLFCSLEPILYSKFLKRMSCDSGESRNPGRAFKVRNNSWIPAFAGMAAQYQSAC